MNRIIDWRKTMEYPDKYHLTRDQNRRFAKTNFTQLIHTNSRFEGINTTLPQTQTIIDGLGVDGVSIQDINTIVQIKRGWQFIISDNDPLTIQTEKQINKIVAKDDALIPGEFRTGDVTVSLGGEEYAPNPVSENDEKNYLQNLMNEQSSITKKAIELMYHNMRSQLFWDGNKRSATLAANKLMIDNGAGLINIPLDKWGKWNNLLSDYYKTDEIASIFKFTYENAIWGIDLK